MDAGLEPARVGRMKGRAMRRNLMVNAKGLMAAAGVIAACRRLRLPVWSWVDPALMTWARLICLGFGVLVSWNVFCAGKWLGNAWDAQRDRRQAQWVKDMAALYSPPLAQPGNAMQEHVLQMMALQSAMAQSMTSMAARAGQPAHIRYMLPPLITMTGPQPKAIGGACGKCGQPMSAHLYYGRGECCYEAPKILSQPLIKAQRCAVCGGAALVPAEGDWAALCNRCRPGQSA